jgi:hypothetical protein
MRNRTGRWAAGALALGFLAAIAGPALAAWPHDPFVNVPLSTSNSVQTDAVVVADGAGGAIVVWCDDRGYPQRVCAQRVAADGALLWDPAGVVISRNGPDHIPDYDPRPVIVADGAGGAVVAWGGWGGPEAYRTTVIAQRVTADGAVMWGDDGVLLCGSAGYKDDVNIAADGAGGAVVVWADTRRNMPLSMTGDIYAQKVAADGSVQWADDGQLVSSGAGYQIYPAVVGDGDGGAIVTWNDFNRAIYAGVGRAQRIAANGSRAWLPNGVVVTQTGVHYGPALTEDGAGGAIVAWNGSALLAQRLSHAGVAQWASGGVTVGSGQLAAIVCDGAGGAIITWGDHRGTDIDIYAQRISGTGVRQWATAGVAITTAPGDQGMSTLAADGAGGALVSWVNLVSTPVYIDNVFAQRVTPTGELLWSRGGAAVCIADEAQYPGGIVSDGAGGAIVAWTDYRTAYPARAYAQWIDAAGATFRSEPVINSVRDVTPDQGGKVRIRWSASNLDHAAAGTAMYGVWRQTAAKDGVPTWESLGTVMARGDASYSFTAVTFADSCAAGSAPSTFMVDFHLLAWGEVWGSNPATGCSVDNLAPARPAHVHLASGGRLAWDTAVEPDFRQFTVYGSSLGRLDDSATVVAQTTNNSVDIAGLAYPYLLVTSSDIHDNESAASGTSALSGVEISPVACLRLHANTPNPFNPRTTIAYDLPRAGHARLDIYDAGGKLVRRLVDADLAAGRHEAAWDGRNDDGGDVASGTYLVLFASGDGALRRKMTLLR